MKQALFAVGLALIFFILKDDPPTELILTIAIFLVTALGVYLKERQENDGTLPYTKYTPMDKNLFPIIGVILFAVVVMIILASLS